jgi:hypothetical protein
MEKRLLDRDLPIYIQVLKLHAGLQEQISDQQSLVSNLKIKNGILGVLARFSRYYTMLTWPFREWPLLLCHSAGQHQFGELA